jgi:pSer/pThr/pTyr-binding forkhead associated (FHA) protein
MAGALTLTVDKGPSAGAVFPLTHGTVTIGRGPGDDVVLTGDEFVTARHARIVCSGTGAVLWNQSANGTLVNGRSVSQVALSPGDLIAVGARHLLAVRLSPASAGTVSSTGLASQSSGTPRFKLPLWLMVYLALIVVAFGALMVRRLAGPGTTGLPEIRVEEQAYATARRYASPETERVMRLLDTAFVHERRGDRRSAYEAYREVMSARTPIDPRSPAYRFAASRVAAIGLK